MVRRICSEELKFNEKIGIVLRLKRQERGLSQTQLSKELNISFQQLQKYEKGKNRLSAYKLTEISRLLNIPLNLFFDDSLFTNEIETLFRKENASVIKLLNSLDPKDTAEICAIMLSILKLKNN